MKKLNAIQMLTACGSHLMKLALSLTLVAAMSTGAYADCQLNCNQHVQVSLDNDCEATITYKTMLQDPDNPAICSPNGASAYVVDVITADGTHLGDKITKDNLKDGVCGVTYLVKVKHWASGNICWGSILVEDKIGPKGRLKDQYVYCYEDLSSPITDPYKIAYDNCDWLRIVDYAQTTIQSNCPYDYNSNSYSAIIYRDYTIADECGNTTVVSHRIYMAPVWPVAPQDYYSDCKNPKTDPSDTGYPTIGGHSLKPGGKVGYCEFSTSYQDWVVDECLEAGTKLIVRTWKIENNCTANFKKYEQRIHVQNKGPWVDPPATESLWLGTNVPGYSCEYYGTIPAPRIGDKCSAIVSITAVVFHGDKHGHNQVASGLDIMAGDPVSLSEGPFVVEYSVTDACHATTVIHAYGAVYDNTPPTAVADSKTTVELDRHGDCAVKLYAKNLDSGSYDNCAFYGAKVARMGASGPGPFGDYVEFTKADACNTHMVVFRVYDEYGGKDREGLHSQVMIEVEVQDNFIAFDNLADKVIDCSGDDDWDAAASFDTPGLWGCTAAFVGDPVDVVSSKSCGQSVYKRTWRAVNCKGIETSVSQTIRIRYVGTIDFKCPKNVDFDCGNGETAETLTQDRTGAPTVTVTGCAVAAVSEPYDEVFRHEGEGDGCFKIKRSWNIIDWCNGGTYVGSCQQLITVTDKVRPVVSCDDVDVCITAGCDATFKIPAPTVVECTAYTTEVAWRFTAKDGATSAGSSSVGANVTFGPGVLILKYIVRDACGNFGNAACKITVTDCKDPTPFCRDIGTAIMNNGEITIWASDFLLYAEDNCTDKSMVESSVKMRLNGSGDTPTASLRLTCDDLGFAGGFAGVQVDIIVWDMAGNSDYCTTSFQIQDNEDNCAGSGGAASIITNFSSEEGESIENVSVNLTGGAMNQSQMTTSSGVAQFSNVPMNGDYEVSGEKDVNYLNGVSTYDVVLLMRHILAIDKLNSPYKLIAADVNGSGTISTGDILALRKAILAITDDFGGTASWRFVDATYTFPNPTNPFEATFPEKLNVSNLDHDMTADFVSIKIGDINGSAEPNQLLGSPSFDGASMVVGLEDVQLIAGQSYDIDFKAKNFNHFGYQFTLGFDQEAIVVNDVTPGALEGLSQNNFGMQMLSQGAITTSWDNANGVQLADNNTIFTMSITATVNTTLSEVLNINSSVTAAEAVNSELEATNVELEFFNRASAQFELFQNTPNPFSTETLIEFSLPEADQVTFKVFDVSGKVIHEQIQNLDRGTHQIRLSKDDLGAAGVLYYQVETSRDVATKKMITIE